MTIESKLSNINSFIVYYGHNNLENILIYDLAIIDYKGHKENDIKFLKDNNVVTLAYLSVVEMNTWEDEFSNMKSDDFLCRDGNIIINNLYDTYMMDIFSENCRNYLLKKINILINKYKFDGLFLDTISNIEYTSNVGARKIEYLLRITEFLEYIKTLFPNIIIFQNNGYNELVNYTADIIDGITIENPDINLLNSKYNSLSNLLEKYGNKIHIFFVLDKKTCLSFNEVYRKINNDYNKYLLYVSENNYL